MPTTTTASHSPTPWHKQHHKNGSREEWIMTTGGGNRCVEIGRIYDIADARLIVRTADMLEAAIAKATGTNP